MRQVNVTRLHEANSEALSLAWITGRESSASVQRDAVASAALIGHLNLTHPNSIQVIGAYEAKRREREPPARRADLAERLIAGGPSIVIFADGVAPFAEVVTVAQRVGTAVFASPAAAARVIEKLTRYLAKALAETAERHGVLMDVLGLGVLITGDSGVGKSELGLELISRGHGLVADDVVEISRLAASTLEGRCPALLRDFLEVRGLGLLNIRTIFGETAVRPKMKLKLIAHLEKPLSGSVREARERLPLAELSEDILGITVRKVVIPVAEGRNLAVLVEAAVRNYILQLRGVDSMAEFMLRQKQEMESSQEKPEAKSPQR
jgi:HPr kinase/phosphorylase